MILLRPGDRCAENQCCRCDKTRFIALAGARRVLSGQAICEVIMSIALMGFKHLRRMGGGVDVRR
jgi:hypothetical protein